MHVNYFLKQNIEKEFKDYQFYQQGRGSDSCEIICMIILGKFIIIISL